MKEKAFRIIALILLTATVCGTAIGCRNNKGNSSETTEHAGTKENHRDDLPKLDFDGESISFCTREFDWYNKEITVSSDDMVDIVDAAVYTREQNVIKRLNVKIENKKIAGSGQNGFTVVMEAINTDISTGDGQYQIGVNNIYHSMARVADDLFYDLNTLKYVDTSKEYYSSLFVRNATIGNKLYAIMGDGTLTGLKFSFATFFDKSVAADMKIDDLYQTVLDGKWTWEYQLSLIRDTWKDIGDQPYAKDENDNFGLITNAVLGVDPYWSAFNLGILKPEEDGFEIMLNNKAVQSKMSNSLEAILALFYDSNGTYVLGHEADDKEMVLTAPKMLSEHKTLFATLRLDAVETAFLRNMDDNAYGIIPMPKYNEQQKYYYSQVHDLASVFLVSAGTAPGKLDAVGATIECFFSESEDVRHQFFEVCLKTKYQDDANNCKMLDLIANYAKIDAGWIYSDAANGIALCLRTLVQSESTNFASWYARSSKKLETSISNFVNQFDFLSQ